MIAAALFLLAGCSRSKLETGRLGRITLRTPAEAPRGVVFLFSAGSGWGSIEDAAASELASRGVVVVGIDLRSYRSALDASDGQCLYLLSEIEELSQQLQRELGFPSYFSPILAGVGEGGALARAALQQSPAATVAGSVAIDPPAAVRTRLPLCPGDAATKTDDGYVYGPLQALPGFLAIAFSRAVEAAGKAQIESVIARGEPAVIVTGEGGDARSVQALLADVVDEHLAAGAAVVASDALGRNLPAALVELGGGGSSKDGDPLVIVLSGDGGWRDLDKTIAEYLRTHGAYVVGWDSLRYFWRMKTPEGFAADLDAVIRFYATRWHTNDVVLAGYSFGADVLPFAYNRLPAETRANVRELSLLGFSKDADFEIHISGWLGASSTADSLPVKPELARIAPSLVQCFYGAEEDDTLCPALQNSGAEIVRTAGDHHFDGNYDALAQKILDGFAHRRRASENARAQSNR